MDLENEAKHTRDLNQNFKEQIDSKLRTLQDSTCEMKVQVREIAAEVFKRSFENEAINIRARTQLSTMEADLCKLKTHLQSTDKEIKAAKTAVEESFATVQRDSVAHIRNIENVLSGFTNKDCHLTRSITFRWVLENFSNSYDKGDEVFSPIFYPNVGGYCFQLCVRWSGSEKEYLGIFLQLHRDPTQENLTASFNQDYTLAVHDAEGGLETYKVTRRDVLRQGALALDMTEAGTSHDGCGVSDMLAAPYDQFVVNNSLFVSCTVHF